MQRPYKDESGPHGEPAWRRRLERLKEHPLARVGPGLITGVADDDPSGIATYSQAGAQYGLNMLWTMPLCFPLMAAVQSMCARIGRVTGKGLAANIKTSFPPIVLQAVVLLLLVANTLNIAADVAAMGEVAELVTRVDRHLMTLVFVLGTLVLQIFVPYHRYVVFLKWLTLSLLAYAAVLFTVHVPWAQVAVRTVLPKFKPDSTAAAVVVGVFGTTISPYLFFWQASEEVEDMQRHKGAKALTGKPGAVHIGPEPCAGVREGVGEAPAGENAHEAMDHEHHHVHHEHHQYAHAPGEPPNHWRFHAPMRHKHPHYPDLHHRHGHVL